MGVSSFITKPVTFAELVEVMKTFGKYWIEIVAIPQKDNRHCDVSITLSPVQNEVGEIIGASAISRDLTERKVAHQSP